MGLLGWLYGADELQAKGNELDLKLQQLNRDALESGHWTPDIFEIAEKDRSSGMTGDVEGSINSEFLSGWNAAPGIVGGKIRGFLQNLIGNFSSTIFKSVPWQVWLVLVLFVLWKLGVLGKVWRGLKLS